MSSGRSRRDGLTIAARDPSSPGQTIDVLISFERMQITGRLGLDAASDLAFNVREILENPIHIFSGLREERDHQGSGRFPGWLCYCSIPINSFRPDGSRDIPFPGQVFLVFVNDDLIAYNWRWEDADQIDDTLPARHDTRFDDRLT